MIKESMTVSIIIAAKACCENLRECVSKCLELDTSTASELYPSGQERQTPLSINPERPIRQAQGRPEQSRRTK